MERYERQIILEEIGTEGQQRLRNAKVLIVGVGGLGSPTALYLAAAGIGHIALMDNDVVSTGNLHRQILYNETEVGLPKPTAAAARLRSLNSQITIEPITCRLDEDNAARLIAPYDIVVDGCDNFETRYLIDQVCHSLYKPYVYGAVQGFEGQVSVFDRNHSTLRYHELYPQPAPATSKAIVGMTPAMVGSVQAHEVMKIICGYGDILYNRLWTIDLKTMQSYIIEL